MNKHLQPIIVPVAKPVCRTPIKPAVKHTVRTEYTRKLKHKGKVSE